MPSSALSSAWAGVIVRLRPSWVESSHEADGCGSCAFSRVTLLHYFLAILSPFSRMAHSAQLLASRGRECAYPILLQPPQGYMGLQEQGPAANYGVVRGGPGAAQKMPHLEVGGWLYAFGRVQIECRRWPSSPRHLREKEVQAEKGSGDDDGLLVS